MEEIKRKRGRPKKIKLPEEIKTFNDIYLMPAQLDGLRNEAESILTDILNVTYGEKLKEVEIRLEASLPSEMKKEYLQLLRKMKKQFKATEDCKEKEQFILAIDNYIKTIKSDEISDNDLIEYLKREMKKNETI